MFFNGIEGQFDLTNATKSEEEKACIFHENQLRCNLNSFWAGRKSVRTWRDKKEEEEEPLQWFHTAAVLRLKGRRPQSKNGPDNNSQAGRSINTNPEHQIVI